MAKLKPAPKAILILAVTAAIGFGVYKTGVLESKPKPTVTPTETAVAQPVQSGVTQPEVVVQPTPPAAPEVAAQSSNAGIEAVLKAAGKK